MPDHFDSSPPTERATTRAAWRVRTLERLLSGKIEIVGTNEIGDDFSINTQWPRQCYHIAFMPCHEQEAFSVKLDRWGEIERMKLVDSEYTRDEGRKHPRSADSANRLLDESLRRLALSQKSTRER